MKLTQALIDRGSRLKIVSLIAGRLNQGSLRSVKAKKNILGGFVIRGMSIAISLIFVPLTIDYVNPARYGIWLTLSSIVGWFSFFDIGLTGGLQNKFAEAIAKGEDDLAQTYVSTIYATLAIIFGSVWLLFLLINQFLDWSIILNVAPDMNAEVTLLAVIVFTYFCFQFVLRIISTILTADQQPAKSSLIDLLGQFISLILVVILIKTTEGSLIKLAIALCLSPLLVLTSANLLLFRKAYRRYRPMLSKVNFSKAKGLFSLGLTFFVIQIAYMIQYQSANIIIAQNFGTTEVTAYNIVYKYFGILEMVFLIFLTPFWSASTEAYIKNDLEWIRSGIKKYSLLHIGLFVVSIFMLLASQTVYELWLGKDKLQIDFSLSLWGFIFFNIGMFGGKYGRFLNGISALRLQFFASLISPIIYVAIALFLIKYYQVGVSAVFIAAAAANFNAYLIAPIQYFQIVIKRSKAKIWYK